MDASLTGAGGVVSQNTDLTTAQVISFWSGKFNSAQQNYPVHEQELLAVIESLK
jgi:RNase H-like domain found in reverse transcriptase